MNRIGQTQDITGRSPSHSKRRRRVRPVLASRPIVLLTIASLAFALLAATAGGLRVSNASFAQTSTNSSNHFGSRSAESILATALWRLDANAPNTLFQDVNCTVPATSVGQPVRCWKDVNNSARKIVADDATPHTVATDPTTGRRVVHANNGSMIGPDLFGGSVANLHVTLVTRQTVSAENYGISLNGYATDSATRFTMHLPHQNGSVYWDPGSITPNRAYTAGVTLGTTFLVNGWKDQTLAKNGLRINFRAEALSLGYTTAASTGGFKIGTGYNDWAEILVYNRHLSAGEQKLIDDLLVGRWSIPV